MFVLQGINAVFGIALVWMGVAADLLPVVMVGGVLIAFALVLFVFAWRAQTSEPGPRDPGRRP